jgi:hypothetical protein
MGGQVSIESLRRALGVQPGLLRGVWLIRAGTLKMKVVRKCGSCPELSCKKRRLVQAERAIVVGRNNRYRTAGGALKCGLHAYASRAVLGAAVILAGAAMAASGARAEMRVSSPIEAFHQGVSAYLNQRYEIAVPALEAANAARANDPKYRMKLFFAPFYLARIYSGMHPAYIDHGRAFELYNGIVRRHAFGAPERVDVDNIRHAPVVGKALTEVARYLLRGIPEAGIAANRRRAITYLTNAANVYNQEDAQFELAKIDVEAGGHNAIRTALYRLYKLAKYKCHAGALVTLADFMIRGKHSDYLVGSRTEALALARDAMKCAPENERLWVEGIFQNIYCQAGPTERAQAPSVRSFNSRITEHLSRRTAGSGSLAYMGPGVSPSRVCPNGDAVPTRQEIIAADASRRGASSPTPYGPPAADEKQIDGIIIANQRPEGVELADDQRTLPPAATKPMYGTLFNLGLNVRQGKRLPATDPVRAEQRGSSAPAGFSLITPPPSNN